MIAIGKYSPELTESEKKIVELFKADRVTLLWKQNPDNLKLKVAEMISRASLHSGISKSDPEKAELTREVILSCLNSFPSITISELENAIKNGIRGEYGDYFGLNVATLHKFIKAFLNEQKRIDAIKKQIDFESTDVVSEITDEDKKRLEKEFWEREKLNAEKYKRGEKVDIFAPIQVMKWYEEAGIIKLTNEEKALEWYYSKLELTEQIKAMRIQNNSRELRDKIKRFETCTAWKEFGEMTELDKLDVKTHACRKLIEREYFNG